MGKNKKLDVNTVRVIKISKEALFEFIYESFIADQKLFFDVDDVLDKLLHNRVLRYFDMR